MKKALIPVLAVLLAVGGYLYGTFGLRANSSDIVEVKELPAQIADTAKEGIAPEKYINAFVTKVVDGDTIDISYKDERERVRLLDVDTPESVKEGVPAQPYSLQASGFTKKRLLNQPVKLVFSKGLKDRYGRLLAYVVLKDGTFFNALLVRNGFARVESIRPNTGLEDYFMELQGKAIEEKKGIWGLPPDKQPFVKDGRGGYVPRYSIDGKAS